MKQVIIRFAQWLTLLLSWLTISPLFVYLASRWKMIGKRVRILLFLISPLLLIIYSLSAIIGYYDYHRKYHFADNEVIERITGVAFPEVDIIDYEKGRPSFTGDYSDELTLEMEHELKEMSEILKYAKQYVENKPYHYRYQKSKNPDQYFRNHDMQLILYDGAVNELRRHNINLKNLDLDRMSSDYQVLWDKKEELKKTYKSTEKEISDMQKEWENVEKYLGIENDSVVTKSQEHSR